MVRGSCWLSTLTSTSFTMASAVLDHATMPRRERHLDESGLAIPTELLAKTTSIRLEIWGTAHWAAHLSGTAQVASPHLWGMARLAIPQPQLRLRLFHDSHRRCRGWCRRHLTHSSHQPLSHNSQCRCRGWYRHLQKLCRSLRHIRHRCILPQQCSRKVAAIFFNRNGLHTHCRWPLAQRCPQEIGHLRQTHHPCLSVVPRLLYPDTLRGPVNPAMHKSQARAEHQVPTSKLRHLPILTRSRRIQSVKTTLTMGCRSPPISRTMANWMEQRRPTRCCHRLLHRGRLENWRKQKMLMTDCRSLASRRAPTK
mmetsp:Transcript_124331/g.398090  ORF Transcript_124331/g.398090 Transcript_124331/m.398090 type:complete len:310 (+) Transcript_124331:2372-3301(+)